jgi:hypothetical protein
MLVRGVIDRDQKAAADWFRKRSELARFHVGSTWSVSSLKKGSSRGTTILPVHVLLALEELADVKKKLGLRPYAIMVDVCDVGLSLSEVANHWYPKADKNRVWYFGEMVREILMQLVVILRADLKKVHASPKKDRFYRAFQALTVNQSDWKEPSEADKKGSSRRAKKI